MVCIWEGSLDKIWDAIQFCQIVRNVSIWAEKLLRKQISDFINQWRAEVLTPESQESLDPVQTFTTREETVTITAQKTTLLEEEIGTKSERFLYASTQETGSYQVNSNRITSQQIPETEGWFSDAQCPNFYFLTTLFVQVQAAKTMNSRQFQVSRLKIHTHLPHHSNAHVKSLLAYSTMRKKPP